MDSFKCNLKNFDLVLAKVAKNKGLYLAFDIWGEINSERDPSKYDSSDFNNNFTI